MKWDPSDPDPKVGSFMPGLIWAVEQTSGPLLEFGAGYFSTPFLHEQTGRLVVSYEYDPEWFVEIQPRFASETHQVISTFEQVPPIEYSVVLIDCEGHNRQPYFDALKDRTEVFVIHDTQYPYVSEESCAEFRYRYDFDEDPRTTLLSNVLDVRTCGL